MSALVAIKQFNTSLTHPDMVKHLSKLLPPQVSVDRFTRTTMVAIQNNPSVLEADRQSLYNAISRAAQDGLMPDGREAALVMHNTKAGRLVRYSPMVEGIIKQLGVAGIKVYAATVYSNESFELRNDETGQSLRHSPIPFGNRGEMIGVYAVAKVDDQTFVETMNLDEIDKVRAASRSGENGPWKVWYDRMAQKSVLHRLKKRLPILDAGVSDSLRTLDEEAEEPVIIDQSADEQVPMREEPLREEREVVGEVTHQYVEQVEEPKARPKGLQAVMDKNVDDGEDLF